MFSSSLVNPPYQDPALLLTPEGLAVKYLFDCGTLYNLPKAELLKITRVFLSHAHIDHLIGLDHLVRCQLYCDHTLEFYGPPPLARQIGGRLRGYTWNLTGDSRFRVAVHELHPDFLLSQTMRCAHQFRSSRRKQTPHPGWLTLENDVRVRWTPLVHGVDCLGYRLDWPTIVHFDAAAALAQGLQLGPWIAELKREMPPGHPLLRTSPGPSFSYIADTRLDGATRLRLAEFVHGSQQLWCEATYTSENAHKAEANLHATAAEAAHLAREGAVGQLHLFHFSRRYNETGSPHLEEARQIFPATVVGPVYPISRSSAGTLS